MTTQRAHPVGCLRTGSVQVPQHQRPDRKALLVGQQAGVTSPAGVRARDEEEEEGEEGKEEEEEEEEP